MTRWRSTGIVALRDSKLKALFSFFSLAIIYVPRGVESHDEMTMCSFQQTFPDEVLDLDRSVRTLDLTHNRLVPFLIGEQLIPLRIPQQVMVQSGNSAAAVDVPVEIGKLVNMQRLILADNLIERLPMNLGKLQSLKAIALDGNQISTLPDECNILLLLENVILVVVYFSALGQLVRLERLSISGNVLTSLPETIGSLRNTLSQLLLLNVSNNKLKFLPESVGSCFSLEELQANDNSIDELPASVCNLIHLKSLCLNNNSVKQMEGFQEFEARRKKKFDKQIDSNVMISSKGLDEGVDL
ncbi:hypothetical protein RJ639_045155 [Escallonia herrerae]|uniref:Plant intracellular Ras-group-related LRR protein 7 n=1 Tax=Escallonia herrerae TaxID=1293975 RepID=A0AA88W6V4_9ASTE|nr:hypothetical protein RJ639_045155 [Escallonia herrerae]